MWRMLWPTYSRVRVSVRRPSARRRSRRSWWPAASRRTPARPARSAATVTSWWVWSGLSTMIASDPGGEQGVQRLGERQVAAERSARVGAAALARIADHRDLDRGRSPATAGRARRAARSRPPRRGPGARTRHGVTRPHSHALLTVSTTLPRLSPDSRCGVAATTSAEREPGLGRRSDRPVADQRPDRLLDPAADRRLLLDRTAAQRRRDHPAPYRPAADRDRASPCGRPAVRSPPVGRRSPAARRAAPRYVAPITSRITSTPRPPDSSRTAATQSSR